MEFTAYIGRGKSFFASQICVRLPPELPDEYVRDIVPRLVLGLKKLRYQYLIYRPGEVEMIPEEERAAAIVELCEIGFGVKNTHASSKEAKIRISKALGLMNKTRGVRENIDVLDRSDSFADQV